jgi:lipopolysaccharide transport system ATP-binding protein
MTFAIKVENLGKRYVIGHRKKESYATLRDTIAQGVHNVWQRLRYPSIPAADNCVEDFWALRDVNFEIHPGDRVGIIGRNGAGKSTLLKVLSRITEPTTGRFVTRGRVASLLEVGTGFHPELTGRENIYLNGAILGMTRADVKRQFDAIVDFSGVEKFLDTPVKRYSSGMYVRLAFAVAAHLDPDILIVDEVLAVGDAEFQKKCLGKMEEVGKEGRTVVFVSHNMGAVRRLCDRGMVATKGCLASYESIDSALQSYLEADSRLYSSNLDLNSNRRGNGKFVFTSIELLNVFNELSLDFMSGDFVKIRLKYKTTIVDFNPLKLIITVSIQSMSGETIAHFISDEMPTHQNRCDKEIMLEIPKLLLRGGDYLINLFSAYGTTDQENICDCIEHATLFKVLPNALWNKALLRQAPMSIIDGSFNF